MKELLQAAGFATTDGGTPLEFGSEPKLSLKVDFTAAQRVPGVAIRKTILVPLEHTGCQALPESFVSYLAAKDFRLVAWCDSSVITPLFAAIPVDFVPTGKPALMADAVLEALSLKARKDYSIEIVVGQTGAAPLRVTVDRYFEAGGKRFFLDFGNAAPNRATLFRLLELAGYQKIAVGDTDDFRTVAAKISAAVNDAGGIPEVCFFIASRWSFCPGNDGNSFPATGHWREKNLFDRYSPGTAFFRFAENRSMGYKISEFNHVCWSR